VISIFYLSGTKKLLMPNRVYDNILQTVGNTPLVRLNRVVADLPCKVYAKVETFNPGKSTKDRMALTEWSFMLQTSPKVGLYNYFCKIT
jgi:threonine dehydratase